MLLPIRNLQVGNTIIDQYLQIGKVSVSGVTQNKILAKLVPPNIFVLFLFYGYYKGQAISL